MRVSVALVSLLVGCGAGDLTLPEASEPVTLSIVSGDGQRADAGTLLDRPLVVQVLDDFSNPVPGASVEFSFLGEVTGAGVNPGVVTTGDDGTAEAFVRLGTDSGTQMILARVVGAATPELTARFRVTALEVRGGGGHDDGGPGKGKEKGHGGDEEEEEDD
jgi:hypothetical protein